MHTIHAAHEFFHGAISQSVINEVSLLRSTQHTVPTGSAAMLAYA